MNDIFEKLYNLYLILLGNLEIGYEMDVKDLEEIWELIQTLYFVKFGHPTADEMLYLADKYETVGAFLEDIDFEN